MTAEDAMPMEGLCMWLKSSKTDVEEPCQDGERLYEWLDESSNEQHCRQPETTIQPCYRWNMIGTQPGVFFDGKQMFCAEAPMPIRGDADRTFIHVLKFVEPPVEGVLMPVLGIRGKCAVGYQATGAGIALVLSGGGDTVVTKPVFSKTTAGVVAIAYSGGALMVRYNSAVVPTAVLPPGMIVADAKSLSFEDKVSCTPFGGDLSEGPVTVGGAEGDGGYFSGVLGEIAIFSRALSSKQLADVETLTASKYKLATKAIAKKTTKALAPIRSSSSKQLRRPAPKLAGNSTTMVVGPGPPIHRALTTSYSAPRLTPMAAFPYNPKTFHGLYTGRCITNPSMKFDQTKRFGKNSDDVPGVGKYNPARKIDRKKQSFTKTDRFYTPFVHTNQETPGIDYSEFSSFKRINGRIQTNRGSSFGKTDRWGRPSETKMNKNKKPLPTPSPTTYNPNRKTYLARNAVTAIGKAERFEKNPEWGTFSPGPKYKPESFDYPGDHRPNPNSAMSFGKQGRMQESAATLNSRGPDLTPMTAKVLGGSMGRATRWDAETRMTVQY